MPLLFCQNPLHSYTEIGLDCIDLVSRGEVPDILINTQAEYDLLTYQLFQKPLDDYWNTYYQSTLNRLMQLHPGLSDSAYAALVRQIFYSVLPFIGTDSCTHPVIDFAQYTLIGQDANASGCRMPEYQISVLKDDNKKQILYSITIKEYGFCEPGFPKNMWILVPKIPDSFKVVFRKFYITLPR